MSKIIHRDCNDCDNEAVVECDECGVDLCEQHTLRLPPEKRTDMTYDEENDFCGDCFSCIEDDLPIDAYNEYADDLYNILFTQTTKKNRSSKKEAIKKLMAVLNEAELQL